MRVLVTGIGGFVGPTLAGRLAERGHEVHGIARRPPDPTRFGGVPVALHRADVREPEAVRKAVAAAAPDAIVHLAALTFVPEAEADPQAAYRTNVLGTLAVLAGVRAAAPAARVLVVSSSDVYGAVRSDAPPVAEDAPMRPRSIYGASKAAAELTAAQWGRAYGLAVLRVRAFNHTGPGQDPRFVCAAFARQVAAIEAGRRAPILRVGNVDSVRDFSDVGDVAEAYAAVLEQGRPGSVYNVCSGTGVSIAEVIAILRTHAQVPLQARSDAALRRPAEVPRLVGDPTRLRTETGWQPRTSLDATLGTVLADWRRRVAAGAEG